MPWRDTWYSMRFIKKIPATYKKNSRDTFQLQNISDFEDFSILVLLTSLKDKK